MSIRIISTSDIARCPKHSLLPQHYRDDGSCLCKAQPVVTAVAEEPQYPPPDRVRELIDIALSAHAITCRKLAGGSSYGGRDLARSRELLRQLAKDCDALAGQVRTCDSGRLARALASTAEPGDTWGYPQHPFRTQGGNLVYCATCGGTRENTAHAGTEDEPSPENEPSP
jgi:hypothetical protein